MGIYNKIKWVLGISLIFFLIVATNLIDKRNFTKIKDAVVTIYEDRLIAKDILFELSLLIQEKKMANALSNTAFFQSRNNAINMEIEGFISQYLTTKLTQQEELFFSLLQNNIDKLKQLEGSTEEGQVMIKESYENQVTRIEEYIYDLSKLQLEEGRRQLGNSRKAIDDIKFFTQMEIYFLAFLAVLIQIMVIYRPTKE